MVSSLHVDTVSRLPYAVGMPTKKTAIKKVPVTRRSLIARINRKLAHDGQKLRKSSPRCENDLGQYHTIDVTYNRVELLNVDVEAYARELEVMAAWEELVEE